ncbi:HupE/UreJ family protein [Saccharopolyspora sp. K220]|uniref:HupE/UreJ family protein n=1 Tax=Saccharopolyspora soli TaxID=2926618 RepID=UPI001F5947BF|nr:HupE/UreJ family protein [Saccharopolyspora soli]MCI2420257.1 HupE/UreJ family protein [Saccharopolyspora soli]
MTEELLAHQRISPATATTWARWGATVAVLTAALLAMLGSFASAHVRSTEGTSQIRQDGSTVRYELSVEYDLLAAAAGLGSPDAAEGLQRLLERQHDRLASYLTERVTVSVDGVQCEAELVGTGVEDRQGLRYAHSSLVYSCPGSPSGAFTVRYGVFSETDAVVDDQINVADYQLGGSTGTFVFDTAHHEFEAGKTGFFSAVARFAVMGGEHILAGIDHILFLVTLLLGARDWRSVVRLASAFTVAHSVTLGLGALGWVAVPSAIVEPLIALSIVYVAVENIIGGESRHRTFVVFGFGLLHGLGFASALSFTDGLSGRLLGALLSFNVGIELGQLLIVVVLFPVLLFIRRYQWSAYWHTAAAAVAGAFGLVWFFQRFLA